MSSIPRLLHMCSLCLHGCSNLSDMEIFVVDNHKNQAEEKGTGDRNKYLVSIPANYCCGNLLSQSPQCHKEDVLDQHDGVEGDDLQLRALFLQVHITENVDVRHKNTQSNLLKTGNLLNLGLVEGSVPGENPEHHGDPVEDDHQEDPVGVDGGVKDEHQDPGGDGPEPPHELEDDPDPGEHQPVHVVLADVLCEGGQRPTHIEQGERHGDDVDFLDGVSADAGNVGLYEEKRHGLGEPVDHPEDAEVPHLLLDVIQLDRGEEEGVAPDHASAKAMDNTQDNKLPPTHVPIPLLPQHPLGGEDLTRDQGGRDGDQAEPGPGGVASSEECVGGDNVEHDIAKIRGKRHNIEEHVTNG